MAENTNIFGIDIGSKSIKICEVSKGLTGEIQVSTLGKKDVGMDFNGNLIDDPVKLAGKISELVKNSGVKSKNVVLSISESSVFSRLITLPKMPEEEVEEAVYWAMKPVIPVSLDEVNISFLQVNESRLNDQASVNWYAVAAPKKIVDKYEKIVKDAGLNLLAVETESIANTRVINYNYNLNADSVILDFGGSSSSIILVRNNQVVFSQTVEVGSEDLSKAIASDFGIDLAQAELYKISYGADANAGGGKILQSLTPTLDILATELTRTMNYFKDKLNGNPNALIYVTGGGANLKDFKTYIAGKLNIQIEIADSFRRIKIDANVRKQLEQNNTITGFNTAIGLSLKGILNG